MFATRITTSNSVIKKAIDIDGALMTILNENAPKLKTLKILRKRDKMTTLSFIGKSLWNIVKELKTTIPDSIEKSICYSATSLLQHLKMTNLKPDDKAIDEIKSTDPDVTRKVNTEVRNDYYAALHVYCLEYEMLPPIILYGRLFEEDERFQYVSFIFRERVFIVEVSIDHHDVQDRACETICALIRKFRGLPKVSFLIKILGNNALLVAEIDIQNETFIFCESVPDDLVLLNLNEIADLLIASHFLWDQPRTKIEDVCTQTLFYKQPFLEGLYVNRTGVFGYVDQSEKLSPSTMQQLPIVLVYCDTMTQSNFLWNNKPLTVNVKQLTANVECVAPRMPYQQLELLPMNAVSHSYEGGGIRYGDQILYDGPLVIVFD